jgi:hypothetical protein
MGVVEGATHNIKDGTNVITIYRFWGDIVGEESRIDAMKVSINWSIL